LNVRNTLHPEEFESGNIDLIVKLLGDIKNNESKKRLKNMINNKLSKIKNEEDKKYFFQFLNLLIKHNQES
jgi:hypothetical protein